MLVIETKLIIIKKKLRKSFQALFTTERNIVNETQSYSCEICDKTNKIKSKSKHIKKILTNTEKEYGIVVKKYEITKPKNDVLQYILNDVYKGSRNKLFHTFEYRYKYDIKFRNMENNEVIRLTLLIIIGLLKLKTMD